MWLAKLLLTAVVVAVVSELARRGGRLGAFLGALPWTTLLVLGWLAVSRSGVPELASFSRLTFWYVLPSLPVFLAFSWGLERGWGLAVAAALAFAVYGLAFALTAFAARRFGIDLV